MAKVIITLDTQTRACALAIDGMPIDAESFSMGTFPDMDGNRRVYFDYCQRATNPNGMEEFHGYRLPPDVDVGDAAQAEVNSHGLIQVPVEAGSSSKTGAAIQRLIERRTSDPTKAMRDIAAFLRPAAVESETTSLPPAE